MQISDILLINKKLLGILFVSVNVIMVF